MQKTCRYNYKVDPSVQTLLNEDDQVDRQREEGIEEGDPSYTELNDGSISITTKPEIRKGCIWEFQLRLSPQMSQRNDFQKFYVISGATSKKNKSLKKESNLFYLELKIRSKLIRPVKELPFFKVGNVVNEQEPIEIINGIATFRVKFTARPRTVFHKHADMMIMVASLFQGENLITTTSLELIFRGGTGSIHSADNRKKALLNSKTKKSETDTNQMNITNEMAKQNNIVNNNGSKMVSGSMPMLTEYEDFDPNNFWDDFLLNKGDKLMNFDENAQNPTEVPQQNPIQYVNYMGNDNQTINQPYPNQVTNEIIDNTPQLFKDFSFSITGFQDNQNGTYQATLQGTYLNKIINGTVQFKIDLDAFSGSFSGQFN